jgi:hypothetical protein
MTTIHVFVDENGQVTAAGPKPNFDAISEGTSGPVFAGYAAPRSATKVQGFELDIDVSDLLSLDLRTKDSEAEVFRRIEATIRANQGLRSIPINRT